MSKKYPTDEAATQTSQNEVLCQVCAAETVEIMQAELALGANPNVPVLYLLMGIPASGKTTFCRGVLTDPALEIVSQDVSGTRAREWAAFEAALATRRSVAVDDTNVEKSRRGRFLTAAKAAGYRTVGLFFQSVLADCLARNEAREGRDRIKPLAVRGKAAQLELPSRDEGFDGLFFVRIADGLFEIEPWKET